jgi:NAD(P)-dependent dehydrogenase (short-subunit alcohol dehydrogenase family)
MKDFTGRAAFVTGGSRGVGRAIALEFAARGADVAVLYKSRRENADEVAAAIAAHGGKALALPADVGDSDAVAAAFARACEAFGGIRANVISIGLTDTEQAREAFASWGEAATAKVIDAIPLKRIAKPEEIARMAAFLTSEDGAYVTGKVIQVDGGQMIAG